LAQCTVGATSMDAGGSANAFALGRNCFPAPSRIVASTQPPRMLATSAVRHTDALGSTTRYFLPALPVELFRAALQVAAQSWDATSI
jgi:hypothetical protein